MTARWWMTLAGMDGTHPARPVFHFKMILQTRARGLEECERPISLSAAVVQGAKAASQRAPERRRAGSLGRRRRIGGEIARHREERLGDAVRRERGGNEDRTLRGAGLGEDADLPIGGRGVGGGVEFVGDLRLVARQVDGGGPADAGRVPEETEGDFFRVALAAGGADFELERAVFDDRDGRGVDVDLERRLGGDRGRDAVESHTVKGPLVVDVDVVNRVGDAACKTSGWF